MEKYKYSLPLRVRFAETDLQGHVFFGHYLTYFDEALTGYMHAIGWSFGDLLERGAEIYYIHSECDHKGRAFFEDNLDIHAHVARIGTSSIEFEFAAFKKATDELVATGKIIAVAVEPQSKKPVRVPDFFRDAVARFEEDGQSTF